MSHDWKTLKGKNLCLPWTHPGIRKKASNSAVFVLQHDQNFEPFIHTYVSIRFLLTTSLPQQNLVKDSGSSMIDTCLVFGAWATICRTTSISDWTNVSRQYPAPCLICYDYRLHDVPTEITASYDIKKLISTSLDRQFLLPSNNIFILRQDRFRPFSLLLVSLEVLVEVGLVERQELACLMYKLPPHRWSSPRLWH